MSAGLLAAAKQGKPAARRRPVGAAGPPKPRRKQRNSLCKAAVHAISGQNAVKKWSNRGASGAIGSVRTRMTFACREEKQRAVKANAALQAAAEKAAVQAISGQIAATQWSNCGASSGRKSSRANSGSGARASLKDGQTAVKQWSNLGQTAVKRRPRSALFRRNLFRQPTSCAAPIMNAVTPPVKSGRYPPSSGHPAASSLDQKIEEEKAGQGGRKHQAPAE